MLSLFCTGLLIAATACLVCYRQYEAARYDALQADRTAASLMATTLAEHERAKTGVLLSYAQRRSLIRAVAEKDVSAVREHMEGMKRNNPDIDLIFITDRDATIWANYPVFPEAIGQNVADRDWYQGVRAKWEPYTSAVFQLIITGKPYAVATVVPVKDEHGKVVGILANSHRLGFLAKTLENTHLDPDANLSIVDQKGQILLSNRYLFREEVTPYPLYSTIRQAARDNEHQVEVPAGDSSDGKIYLTRYPLEGPGWTVVIERRDRDILRSTYRGFVETGVTAVLLFSLAAVFIFYLRQVALFRKSEELRKSESRYRRLFESIREMIAVYEVERDERGQIVERRLRDGNTALLQAAGVLSVDEIRGKTPAEVFGEGWAEYHLAAVREAMETGEVRVQEATRAESGCHYITTIVPLDADTYLATGRDITALKKAELAVRDGEERLRFALETSHTGAWDLDLVSHTAFRSLEHDRIFGYRELLPEWTYEMFLDHVLTEDRDGVEAKFRHAIDTRSDWRFECRIRRTDGEVRWIHSAGRHRAAATGDSHRMAGIVQDITERKQAEEELQKLASVVQYSSEFINLATLDGMMTFLNPAGAELIGLSTDRVGETHVLQVIPDHLHDRVKNEIMPTLREKGFWEGELQYRNLGTGRLIDVFATTFVVKDPSRGTPLYLANISIDIRQIKQAEEALRESEALCKVIASSTPDHLFVQDRDLKYTLIVNPQLGLTEQDMIGKTDGEFLAKDDAEKLTNIKRRVLETGHAVFVESQVALPGGGPQFFSGSYVPKRDAAGNVDGLIGYFRNVTESKKAEENLRNSEEQLRLANEYLEERVRERTIELVSLAEQLEKSRRDLRRLASEIVMAEEKERKRIAGVLHDDIAQILAAARIRLDLLQSVTCTEHDRRMVEESKALLVQSIRDTRALMMDIGNPVLFDMGLKPACEALADRLMERHPVRIHCDIRDTYRDLEPGVKTVLYQAVREILNNVVKHSNARNARVLIDMLDGNFRVEVGDDGSGFDPGRLGMPTAHSGFGLYSLRERLIAIGGNLRIESAPGAGTVVTVLLPVASGLLQASPVQEDNAYMDSGRRKAS